MTDDLIADFESHHIEGYACAALEAGKDGAFHVPLISHIEGNLWTGGCIDGVQLPDDFTFLLSAYPWERYRLGPNTRRVEVHLYDSADLPPMKTLVGLAHMVNEERSKDGAKVLVHCQAGLNRSALIGALALVLDGMPAAEAIELLRAKRSPVVLCNETFERWLLDFDLRKAA